MACYTDHHVLQQPLDMNGKVWRYLDLPKFISLLHSKSLFFSLPSSFNDPYEGRSAKKYVDELKEKYKDTSLYKISLLNLNISTFVNCWHYNNYESEAMWKVFSDSKNSISIQSNYHKLINCIPEKIEGSKIYAGLIRYIDYYSEDQIINEPLDLFCYKRKAYEHDHEIRLIFDKKQNFPNIPISEINEAIKLGKITSNDLPKRNYSIEINLENLIENIYVSPNSDKWFDEIVRSIIKQYGFYFNLIRSEIDKSPKYY